MLACFLTLFDTFWHILTLFDTLWHANPCVVGLFCFLTRFDTQVSRNMFYMYFCWHFLTRTCIPLANGNRCQKQVSKICFWYVLSRMCTPLAPETRCQKIVSESVTYFLTRLLGAGRAPPMQLPSRRAGCASSRPDHGFQISSRIHRSHPFLQSNRFLDPAV